VEWIGATLQAMAAGDLDGAEAALGNVAERVLGKALAAEVARGRARERDAKAREAWERLEARAQGKVSERQAKALLEELASFEKTHATTAFVKESKERRAGLRERLENIALAFERTVRRLFRGEVQAVDPAAMRVRVFYDFEDAGQYEDFEFKDRSCSLKNGTVRFGRDNRKTTWFPTRRFELRDLDVTVKYCHAGRDSLIHFAFGDKNVHGVYLSKGTCCLLAWTIPQKRWKKRILAEKECTLPAEGTVEIRKRSGTFRVKVDGTVRLEAQAEREPEGRFFRFRGLDNHMPAPIDALTIEGVVSRAWLQEHAGVPESP
jgi:hypothetical protein